MKLVEREYGIEVDIKENIVSIIVLEDVKLRLPLINELFSQTSGKEGNWLLFENDRSFDLGKKVELILEPLTLTLNNKKVKTKLYQDIKTIAQDYCFSQGLEVHSQICNYLENMLDKLPYPVKYDEDWDVSEILKAYNVELVEEYDNIFEKLYNYIKLVNTVCGTDIFIMVNIKQYLTDDQITELYKMAAYGKIQLVLIEFSMNNKRDCEEIYILDNDDCVITY